MAEVSGFYPRRKSILNSLSLTAILIVINVIVFIVFIIFLIFFRNNPEFLYNYLALKPSNIIQGKYLWTFITSMFAHAGFEHLFFNMISLFFIGTFVERIIGRKRYLRFYVISGLVAGIFFVFLAYFFGNGELTMKIFGNPENFGVGASGAIFGLAGLLAVLIPYKKVYLIAGPLIAIVIQALLNTFYSSNSFMSLVNILITLYIFMAIFTMFSFNERTRKISIPIEMPFWLLPFVAIVPLVIVGLFVDLPIANTAHFGGLVSGLVYGIYLKNKYSKKARYLSKHFG